VKAALGMLTRRHVNPLAGAYANRLFQTLRQRPAGAFGMPARSACKPTGGRWLAAAYANRLFQTRRPEVKFASGMPARSACKPAGGRGAYENPLAVSRVCKPPFSNSKARSESGFGYANAERMRTHWWGLVAETVDGGWDTAAAGDERGAA
jgi:hypothetical protein